MHCRLMSQHLLINEAKIHHYDREALVRDV
jgi:hypothetical protein